MKLKRFNVRNKLKQLELKKNKSRIIKISTLVLSSLILVASILYFTLASFEAVSRVDVIASKVGIFVHRINFNADGGNVDPLYKDVKEKSLYGDLPTPTKNGYIFNGWYENDIQVTSTTRMERRDTDVYLIAHWNIGTFELNIDPNEGTWNSYTSIQQDILEYQEEKVINDPTKEGYTFDGWEITGNGTTYNPDTKKIKMGYEKTTIKAKWKINTYELTINSDNGTDIKKYKLEYQEQKEIKDPTKEGHTFAGWDVSTYINNNVYVQPAHDVTMTAKWEVNDYNWIVYHSKMDIDGKNYTVVDTDSGEGNYGDEFTGTLRNYNDFVIPSLKSKTIVVDEDNPPTKNTITYEYIRNKHNLTIDPNGGTYNGSENTTTDTVYFEDTRNLLIPVKSCYSFQDWSIEGDNSSVVDNIFKMGTENTTLTANWLINTYVVTFNANGGSIANSTRNVTCGSSMVLPTSDEVIKKGHTFLGWFTEETNGLLVTNDTIFKSSTTLYAHWQPNTYRITLDPDGGTVTPDTIDVIYDEEYGPLPEPIKKGYRFNGWYKNNELVSDKTVMEDSDVTLVSHYTKNKYKLTVNPNGGTWNSYTSNQTEELEYQSEKEIADPTKEGYTFDGWELTGEGSVFDTETKKIKIGYQDATLKAKWKINTYELTIDLDDGSQPSKYNLKYHEEKSLTSPSKEGHTFSNWQIVSGDNASINGSTFKMGSSDATIKAIWNTNDYNWIVYHNKMNTDGSTYTLADTDTGKGKYGSKFSGTLKNYTDFVTPSKQTKTIVVEENNTPTNNIINYNYTRNNHKLTINPNGGSYNNSTSNTVENVYYEDTRTLSTPIKFCYSFASWSIDGTGSTIQDKVFKMGTSNTTLTANWTINKYAVTFNPNGGTTTKPNQSVDCGGKVTLPTTDEVSRTGYTLLGWYSQSDEQVTNDTTYTSDTVVQAKWDANTYTITFNANGGNVSPTSKNVKYNVAYGTLPTPTRNGYKFNGWFNGDTQVSSETKMGAGNVTLTAHWSINTYSLSVNPNGGIWDTYTSTQSYDLQYNKTKDINDPTRVGYSFVEWKKTGNGSTLANKVFTMGYENATLTAQWQINKYNLTVNLDNGTSNTTYKDIQYKGTKTLDTPTKEGHTFSHWEIVSGENASISGSTFTMGTSHATVKAIYNKNDYNWVAYHNKMNTDGTNYTLADTDTGKADYGSTFSGTLKNYTDFVTPSKQTKTIVVDTNPPTKNIINYNYTRNTHKLTINPNGGNWNSTTSNSEFTMYYEATKTIADPTRSCYSFGSWTKQGSNSTLSNKVFKMGTENATLTANWTLNKYVIDFVPNGGTLSETLTSQTKDCGSTLTFPTSSDISKTGYNFSGWYDNNSFNGSPITSITVSSNKTYYAKWTAKVITCTSGKYLPAGTVSCTACPKGSYCEGGEYTYTGAEQGRKDCPSGYTSDASTAQENKCYIEVAAGKYKTSATGTTVGSCTAGNYNVLHKSYYNATDSCTKCPQGSMSAAAAGTCTVCTNGKTTSGEGKTSCDANCSNATGAKTWVAASWVNNSVSNLCTISTCDTGYTKSGNSCVANKYTCDAGKYLPTGSIECTACPTGSYCEGGEFTYNGSEQGRKDCPSGYTSAASATANSKCYIEVAAGKYKTNKTGTATENCAAGKYKAKHNSYYNVSDSCTNCVQGSTSAAGSGTCTACTNGKTTSGAGKSSCDADCSNKTGVSTWVSASWTTSNKVNNLCTVDTCGTGYDKDTTNNRCTAMGITCEAGKYLPTGSATCTACPANSYCEGGIFTYDGTEQGRKACTSLASGSYTTSSAGSSEASSCYIPKANLSGKYVATANAEPVTCSKGGYCPGTSDVNYGSTGGRTGCGDGKYNANTGSTASTACQSISAGCYGSSGTSACPSECQGRTKFTTGGAKACSTVTVGYETTGCTSGNKCTGQKKCAAGTYCVNGVSTSCVQGSTSAEGSSTCTACTDGKTTSGAGKTSCDTNCSNKTGAATWVSASWSSNNTVSDSCTINTCSAGYYKNGYSCTACVQGSYTNAAGKTACTACTNGKTTSGAGKTSCDADCSNKTGVATWVSASWSNNSMSNLCKVDTCSLGYDKDATNNKCTAKSITCDAGQYLPANSVTCTACTTGNYCEGGTFTYTGEAQGLKPCPTGYTSAASATANTKCYIEVAAGKYKTTATGTATESCTAGKFKAKHNSYYNATDSCTNCVQGATSAAGSGTCTACTNGKTTSGAGKTSCDTNCSNTTGVSTWAAATWTSNKVTNLCTVNTCATGYDKDTTNNKCTAKSITCSEGQYLPASSDTCSACTTGNYCEGGTFTYTGAAQGLKPCPSGYTSAASAKANTGCYIEVAAGKYKTTATGTTTEACAAGKFKAKHNSYYNSTDSCTNCAQGSYTNATGKSACTACTNGKTTSGAGKTSCDANCSNTTGVSTWVTASWSSNKVTNLCTVDTCGTGYDKDTTNNKCTAKSITCSKGQYLPASSITCTDCPANSYCEGATFTYTGSEQGRKACSSLASGSYTTSAAKSGAASSCYIPKANLSGKYVATANAEPVTCSKGGYCPGTSDVNYGSTGGRTGCGDGKYNANTGSTASSACQSISAGCYGSSGTSACPSECQGRTKYSAAGAKSCSTVSSGYETTGCTSGNKCTGQKKCTAGTYCVNGVATSCVQGSMSAEGATACTACQGKTTSGAGKSSCDANCSNRTGVATWVSASWTSSNNTMSNLCKVDTCATGYDKDATNNKCTAKSITCSKGQYLPANSVTCTDCPANSYCEGGTFTYTGSEQGRKACSSLASGSYTTSAAKSGEASSCYIPKANLSGKYVATANAEPVTCTKGYYCAGSSNISYGSTGGRTGCGDGKYNANTGSTASSACQSISAGCYGSSGTSACPSECQGRTKYSAAGAKSCSTVSSGYETTGCTSGNKCTGQKKCAAGTYCVSGVATSCVQGSMSAEGATACTACQGKTTSGAGKSSCDADCSNKTGVATWVSASWTSSNNTMSNLCKVDTCGTGYNKDATNNKCTAKSITCSEGQYLPANSETCSACTTGNYCEGGTFTYTGAAQGLKPCPSGYTSAASATANTKCYIEVAAGKYKTTATGTATESCTAGKFKAKHNSYYNATDSCTNCVKGATSAAGSGTCTACQGKTTSAAGKSSCDADCSNKTGVATWVTASWTSNSVSNSCKVDTCATGYDKDATNNKCTAKSITCDAGKYLPANSVTCTQCPANSYCEGGTFTYTGSEQGRKACSSLASGSYTTSAAGSSAASSCYIPKANLSGKYVATANAEPVTCTKGYYCAGSSNISYGSTGGRTGCGDGKYNANTGSTASSACQSISAGCYGSNGTSACPSECQGRTKYTTGGAKSCSTVSSGYETTGCTSGNKCTGQKKCAAGTYCVSGVATSCVQGSTSAEGATACTACTNGKTTSGAGKSSCDTNCSNNSSFVNSWTSATWNSSNNTVTNLCTINACGTNYTKDGNTCKKQCAAGTYLAGSGTTCSNCTSGNYCAGGTWAYSTSNQGLTACSSLGTGYTSDGGANAKTNASCYITVDGGKYKTSATGTATQACAAGKFSVQHKSYYNSTDSCTNCVKGSYTNATGKSACTACTNGKTTSAAGKTSCDANCSNNANASTWKTASWTNNKVTNLCTINACSNGYYVSSNACVRMTAGDFSYSTSYDSSITDVKKALDDLRTKFR